MPVTPSTMASDNADFCRSVLPGQSFTMTWGIGSILPGRGEIVLVGHLLHPGDVLSIERFLNGDVGHGCRRGGAVPMPVVGRAPDDVARPDLDSFLAFAPGPADAGRDDQRLPERMAMPCGARAGLEGHD